MKLRQTQHIQPTREQDSHIPATSLPDKARAYSSAHHAYRKVTGLLPHKPTKKQEVQHIARFVPIRRLVSTIGLDSYLDLAHQVINGSVIVERHRVRS